MDAQLLHINFTVPQGWHELDDKQLRFCLSMSVLILERIKLEQNYIYLDPPSRSTRLTVTLSVAASNAYANKRPTERTWTLCKGVTI